MATAPEVLIQRGYEARRDHRPADAKELFCEAVALCREADDRVRLAQALTGVGQIERDLNEVDGARQHYEEAVAIYRTLDDPLGLAYTVRHVGDILRGQGERDVAEPCYAEALGIYRKHEATSLLDLANAIRGYALLKGDGGETAGAAALWREAKELYAAVDVQAGVVESERQLVSLTQR